MAADGHHLARRGGYPIGSDDRHSTVHEAGECLCDAGHNAGTGHRQLSLAEEVRPIYRSIREDAGAIDGRVAETFGGIRVVRAFRREKRERRTYSVGHHTVIRKTLFAARVELVLEAVWGILIPFTTLLLVFYGGWQVRSGRMTVGSVFTFQIYAVHASATHLVDRAVG